MGQDRLAVSGGSARVSGRPGTSSVSRRTSRGALPSTRKRVGGTGATNRSRLSVMAPPSSPVVVKDLPPVRSNRSGIKSVRSGAQSVRSTQRSVKPSRNSSGRLSSRRPNTAGQDSGTGRSWLYGNERGGPLLSDPAESPGGINMWSRPTASMKIPLRSCLLDNKVNNIPRQRLWSDLQRMRKQTNKPHPSFDIDGDGVIGQSDLKLGKTFDMDGNGMLDAEEQEIGREIMAREFFSQNEKDLWLYSENFTNKTVEENVHALAKDEHSFTRTMNFLKCKSRQLDVSGSRRVRGCVEYIDVMAAGRDPADCVHNTYVSAKKGDDPALLTRPQTTPSCARTWKTTANATGFPPPQLANPMPTMTLDTSAGAMRRCRTRSELQAERLTQRISSAQAMFNTHSLRQPKYNNKRRSMVDFMIRSPIAQLLGEDRVLQECIPVEG